MSNSIVGIFLNRNEGDILAETLFAATKQVDALYVIDNGSADRSLGIIESYRRLSNSPIVKVIRAPFISRQRALNNLLEEIRNESKPENTWIQMIESDIMILDTDISTAIKDHAVNDIGVSWVLLNAVRENWEGGIDTYPNWHINMKELMPRAHFMEPLLSTFRPLAELSWREDVWRPWPSNFSRYTKDQVLRKTKSAVAPLLLHVGWRGPRHFHQKFKSVGQPFHPKYKDWRIDSVDAVRNSVAFFNGVYNSKEATFPATRVGWASYR